jgi:hypothetical protein
MNPRKPSPPDVSSSFLHLGLQTQLGEVTEWSRFLQRTFGSIPVLILESLGGFGVSRRNFSSNGPFFEKGRT